MTVVTYHGTDVVSFNEKEIILKTGGWKSVTTKLRMNQASNQYDLGYMVSQKDFSWFVTYKGKKILFDSDEIILNRAE